ncbi:hybrid sensor histidine kinase/response regulator [Flavobacterium faecale]|uniref:histidine kinase n=1 Tax=Flavobacterium faecale TaxID=1355330 RepID=A0A2S1LE71_9FLAO|nr:hybrid sensor histidine kinase/response regulator transcription factor [Flavobacterium faecale]AWG22028.1 hybrid sensor histidine kinase/response regulator [Flavobacterium faecale]
MSNTLRYYLFTVLSLLSSVVFAQDKFENYQFQSIQEASSQRAISSIIQDKNGLIWVGTNGAGLYRYDGVHYNMYGYNAKVEGTINSNLIYSTYVDSKNDLWIGTDEGLCRYNRDLDNFTKINIQDIVAKGYDEPISVKTINEDNHGNLIIGTFGFGVFKMNTKTLQVALIQSPLLKRSNIQVNCSVKNKQGTIFLGTGYGLFSIDYKGVVAQVYKDRFKKEPINLEIESLAVDSFGFLWVGTTNQGLLRIKTDADNYQFEIFPVTKNNILALIQSKSGDIVCGTENEGLLIVNHKGQIVKQFLHSKYNNFSLKSNSVWSLFQDKEKRLWLGYYNKGLGIFSKPNNKFMAVESLLNNENSLQTSSVTGVVRNKAGKLLISTEGGGLDIYDTTNKKFIHVNKKSQGYYSGLNSEDIQTVFVDSKQNLWLGSWSGGIYFLKNGSNKFVNYNTANTSGLKSNRVFSFSEDASGRIWIGSFIQGLHYYDPAKGAFVHCEAKPFAASALDVAYVRKVFVDSDNDIWVGTILGLYKVHVENQNSFQVTSMREAMFKNMTKHNSIQTILSVYESNDKMIWIGTDGGGLFSYNKKTKVFTNYNDFPGFKERSVRAIISDNNGCLWVSGGLGLTKIDFKNKISTNFTKDDGLIVNEFNNNAVFKDANGLLYFGSYEGMNYFNPNQIKKTDKSPSLYLSDFKIFNKSVSPNDEGSPLIKVISQTKELELNYTQSVFSIEYVGINYNFLKKNQYAYYLEGFEKDWNYVGSNRVATYTNLAPGDYVFKVKAANSDGSWTQNPLELKINVLPPWWKSIWAYLVYALIVFGVILYLNKIYQNRFKAKQAILFEKEKIHQLEKLNAKKLQFFTNISHEFRTPLTLIINPLEDLLRTKKLSPEIHSKLVTIHKSSDRLSRLINELMDFNKFQFNKVFLQVKKIELVAFTEEVISYFDEEANTRNITIEFNPSVERLVDWLDPKMVEKIIFNIISNAFKFTPDDGFIRIGIDKVEAEHSLIIDGEKVPTFSITIKDTGSGIQKKDINRIFDRFYQVNSLNKVYYGSTGIGLEVVKEFVELHKGKITVESQVGEGTEFKVCFPLGNSFYNDAEIVDETHVIEKHQSKKILEPITVDEDDEEDIVENVEKVYTVLVVEDNAELRNYLKQELSKTYKVLVALNGKRGYEMAIEKLPDLIVTDVIMPVMDGLQLCKKIKGDLKTSHIPLLMLSAKAMVKDRLEGIDSGADLYLSKPFEMDILKSSLAQLITSRQIMFKKFYSGITKDGKEKTTTLDNEFIQKTLQFITDNLSDSQLSVESLSSKLFLSRSQLYRKIKTLTGVSVNEFIRNVRLEKAKEIMSKGYSSVSEVSYTVGFTSPSYFTKCYKLKYGDFPKRS